MFRCGVFFIPCCPSRFALDTTVSPTEGASAPAKVSPPPYATIAGSVTSHHHTTHHYNITSPITSPPSSSSYPAVLVGRTNSESKMKVPPPVPPRGTPKVKRGGASTTTTTTTATGKGDNTFPLHEVFRYPLFLHDALDKITCLMKGRVFGDPSELFDPDAEGVHLKRYRKVEAISDKRETYFSPIVSDLFIDNDICRIKMDDGDVV